MKKYLFGEKGDLYKANLHCHTIFSDGTLTPQQVKDHYKANGYSIVAFTDHDAFIPHPELRDDEFLPLNGLEFAIRNKEANVRGKRPQVHMNFIALEEDTVYTPCYHRTKHVIHNEALCRATMAYDESLPDFERPYTVQGLNDAVAEAKKRGFYVIYNHPVWSFEDPAQLLQYKGLDAIEVYNHACNLEGYEEYTPFLYDHLHRKGMRLGVVAADDNHDKKPLGHPQNDSCGGWVWIQAEALEYRAVTKALQAGDYYASNGAVIHKIWVEDDMLHVTCDPAQKICITKGHGKSKVLFDEEASLTEGSFQILEYNDWVKVTVYDKKGKFAMSRAYFRQEWEG